jgi:hypothetical protein
MGDQAISLLELRAREESLRIGWPQQQKKVTSSLEVLSTSEVFGG